MNNRNIKQLDLFEDINFAHSSRANANINVSYSNKVALFQVVATQKLERATQQRTNELIRLLFATNLATEVITSRRVFWNTVADLTGNEQYRYYARYGGRIDKWTNNRGYDIRDNGTMASVRALEAERKGTFSMGNFVKIYGVSRQHFDFLKVLRLVQNTEWHHTGKSFKETEFFSWKDSEKAEGMVSYEFDGINITSDEENLQEGLKETGGLSLATLYAQNKKELTKITKEFKNLNWEYKLPKTEINGDDLKTKVDIERYNAEIDSFNFSTNGKEKIILDFAQKFGVPADVAYRLVRRYSHNVQSEEQRKAEQQEKDEHNKKIKKSIEEEEKELAFWLENLIAGGYVERFSRSQSKPSDLSIITYREMHGKYGWFNSESKSYNLPEYYSGFTFNYENHYNQYQEKKQTIRELSNNIRFQAVWHGSPYNFNFNEKVSDIEKHIRYLRYSSNNTIYGFVDNNRKVYLNKDVINLNTPIHEFAHLWVSHIQRHFPDLWDKGKELFSQSEYLKEVQADPNYQHLTVDEQIDEAMARAIGDNGEKELKTSLFKGISKWISDVWKKIGATFGIENLSSEQISNLSLRDFTNIAATELLSGKDLTARVNKVNEAKEINDKFNSELKKQVDKKLPAGHIYKLGMPSVILRSAGIPNLPIELSSRRLFDKSQQINHLFDLNEIMNLPNAINNPLAVFRSATVIGSNVILTELKYKGTNFVVAIQTNKRKDKIFINDIRSIHPRTYTNIINWINEGLMDYAKEKDMFNWIKDKIKTRSYLNSSKPAEVREQLISATKVIQNFENPTLFKEKNDNIRFQIIGEKGIKNLDKKAMSSIKADNLQKAKDMEYYFKHPMDIKLATGWERGHDGLWRYEILDGTSKQINLNNEKLKLKDIYDSDELFSAYPQLANIEIIISKDKYLNTYVGTDEKNRPYINIDPNIISNGKVNKAVLVQNIQYLIQNIEGFAKGVNIAEFKKSYIELETKKKQIYNEITKSMKEGNYNASQNSMNEYDELQRKITEVSKQLYSNSYNNKYLAGEIEAKNVARRSRMKDDERLNMLLLQDTEFVSKEKIILLQKEKNNSSIEGLNQRTQRYYQERNINPNTPLHKNDVLAFLQQTGGEGKSKLIEIVRDITGKDFEIKGAFVDNIVNLLKNNTSEVRFKASLKAYLVEHNQSVALSRLI